MKNFLLFIMIAVLFAGSVALPSTASACSCEQPPAVSEELSRSDAVFSGKVIATDDKLALFSPATHSVVFQVARVWKGSGKSQIKIKTGQGGGDCGYDFNVGQEYLVYAVESTMYGANQLTTIICDRTAVLSQAQSDVAMLGAGQEPTEEVAILNQTNWLLLLAGFFITAILVISVYRKWKKIN